MSGVAETSTGRAAGSKWLGRLPDHWREARLTHVAEAWTSNVDKHSVEGQPAIRLCNYTDVYKNDRITTDLPFMTATATPEQVGRFRIHRGDTIITKDSETADDVGVPAFVDCQAEDLLCGYHLAIIRPHRERIAPRFLFWVMASAATLRQWEVLAAGVTRVGIRGGDLRRAAVPRPPLAEQRAIAHYLDCETAKIDALIEKQERLIETLRERRAAVIETHLTSVGGGSSRLRYHALVQSGLTLSGEGDPRCPEWPYLRVANVQTGYVDTETVKTVRVSPLDARGCLLRPGDVLMTEGGDIDKLGRGSFWDGQIEPCLHQNHVFAVRPGPDLDPHFLVYVLEGSGARTYFHVTAKKTTNLASTNTWTLNDLPLLLPSVEEQREVVQHLDEQTAKIDTLITKAEQFIMLAKERRSALITAAVTGQIDVRDQVA